jgi:aspartate/methionine/tyrosine aminotransferase
MGAERLMQPIVKAHQFNTFTTSPALQLGVAHGLDREMDYALENARELQGKRDLIAAALESAGFELLACEGTYFITTSIRGLSNEPDRAFCERLTREAGVTAIPLSAFYGSGGPTHLVRFAFCKKRAVLEEAAKRLQTYFVNVAG